MDAPFTLSFSDFWSWLTAHPNCIVRGGTPEVVIYDDEDYYWHFGQEGNAMLLVQVVRGKRIAGELFIEPERVDYVQAVPSEIPEEHTFELVSEGEGGTFTAYFFVLAHGYESPEEAKRHRVH